MRWPPVIFTDNRLLFRKEWQAAITILFVVMMRPKYEGDEGLYQHEATHVRQFLADPFRWHARYLFSKRRRAEYEAEAYAVQTLHPDRKGNLMTVSTGAFFMTRPNTYSLGMEQIEADFLIRTFL